MTRYCSSSLQTTRMAFHAIRAGEGDVFISAGVECVSRFTTGSSDSWPDTHSPVFAGAEARTQRRSAAGAEAWDLIAARHCGIPPARVAGRDLGEVTAVRLDATALGTGHRRRVHPDPRPAPAMTRAGPSLPPRKEPPGRPWNRRPPDATAGRHPTPGAENRRSKTHPAGPGGKAVTPVNHRG